MTRPKHALRAIPLLVVPLLLSQPGAAMTPQQCYQRDSQCTQFCGNVQDSTWRYECFSRCDIYLDNCLSKGVWTDQAHVLQPTDGGGSGGGMSVPTDRLPDLGTIVLSPQ